MKRALALLMALIMVMCAVAACGGTGDTPTTEPSGTTTASTTVQSTTSGTTIQTTTTTKKPTTPAAPTVATQSEKAPAEVAGKGPFLWLDFETNNIKDGVVDNIAGDGLNAVITGNPAYITSPTGGSAIHFGQSSTFDYLTIANDERLNFTLEDEFTIDFWYMMDRKAAGWDNLFSKGSSKNGWYGVWLGTNDNSNQGVCWGGDTGNHKVGSLYYKYKWHHITIILKNEIIYTYLDGENVGSFEAKNYTSTTDFYIGGRNSSDASAISTAQFHGAIDEFKIYDYAWETGVGSIYDSETYTYEYVNPQDSTQKMTLPYRVYYPTKFDGNTDKYPVLLFLHGHGECGTDNKTQLQVFGPNVLLNDIAAMDNCIIVAPQTVCDGASNVYEWVASGVGAQSGKHVWDTGMPIRSGTLEETIHTVGMQAAEALIKEFVADEKNRVDLNRVYVSGISMGGCATWEIMARNPELFAAGIPLCGSGILSTAASLKDIDIWAFHGTSDPTVLPEGTAKMAEAIKAAGGTKITYTALAGQGHSIWNPSYTYKNANGET
ncbi:MAG: prolyl oligopeptidase family serine peptidase, partial [Clostridia bacterium]|nr:prolyl oligopeptidase family serine peptidase [Clostridia bacterium]